MEPSRRLFAVAGPDSQPQEAAPHAERGACAECVIRDTWKRATPVRALLGLVICQCGHAEILQVGDIANDPQALEFLTLALER